MMFHSDNSIVAITPTVSQANNLRISKCEASTTRRLRTVRFADNDSNQCYPITQSTAQEMSHLWYTHKDYDAFRKAMYSQIVHLRQAEMHSIDPNSLPRSLTRIYLALERCVNVDEIAHLLTINPPIRLDEHTVGLTDHLVPILSRDFQTKRKHLVQMLRSMKCQGFGSEAIRRESCRSSYAARLFARYIGFLSAES